MITLNEDQKNAVQKMHEFYHSDKHFFVLKGSAGTGKTTCVQTFCKEIGEERVVLTAPTNKATKVLREMNLSQGESGCATSTIYSLLGLVVKSDSRVQRVEAVRDADVNRYEIVVVDEASMVDEQNLFGHISECALEAGVKFLFMGDPLQLPPVGEEKSRIFEFRDGAELRKVERHDNEILQLATHLRDCIENGEKLNIHTNRAEDGTGVVCVDNRVFVKQLIKGFTSPRYQERPEMLKCLAWKNDTVAGYNDIVRDVIYDSPDAKFAVGERVTSAKPVCDVQSPDVITMTTDDEGVILELAVVPHPLFKDMTCYRMVIEPDSSPGHAIGYVIHESCKKAHQAQSKKLFQRAKSKQGSWKAYHEYTKSFFHDIRPCYALTTHKSQGSTYETVFVDVKDILSNWKRAEALRCLYVACSRASKNLILRTR